MRRRQQASNSMIQQQTAYSNPPFVIQTPQCATCSTTPSTTYIRVIQTPRPAAASGKCRPSRTFCSSCAARPAACGRLYPRGSARRSRGWRTRHGCGAGKGLRSTKPAAYLCPSDHLLSCRSKLKEWNCGKEVESCTT